MSSIEVKRKLYTLTDEHRAEFPRVVKEWTANGFRTRAMDDSDRDTIRDALPRIYKLANLPAPERILFVASPLTAAIAAAIASGVLWLRENPSRHTEMFSRALTEADLLAGLRKACEFAVAHGIARTRGEEAPKIDLRPTRAATDAATYAATYAATDAATYAATDAATDAATRAATRAATDAAKQVDRQSADGVAYFLLRCLQYRYNMWHGGNQWAGWGAYLSFYRDVAKLDIDWSKWADAEKLFKHCGPLYLHAKFVIVSDFPEFIHVDDRNRPHRMDGPYMRWRDGWELHYVNGIQVAAKVTAGDFGVRDIQQERNAEVRRVMIDRYNSGDAGKFLRDANAKVLHEDTDALGFPRRLLRMELTDDEPIVAVELTNSTPEPDGTRKLYCIRVQPELRPHPVPGIRTSYGDRQEMTCQNAVAATYGFYGHEYQLAVET